jgi:hypothetical protein
MIRDKRAVMVESTFDRTAICLGGPECTESGSMWGVGGEKWLIESCTLHQSGLYLERSEPQPPST